MLHPLTSFYGCSKHWQELLPLARILVASFHLCGRSSHILRHCFAAVVVYLYIELFVVCTRTRLFTIIAGCPFAESFAAIRATVPVIAANHCLPTLYCIAYHCWQLLIAALCAKASCELCLKHTLNSMGSIMLHSHIPSLTLPWEFDFDASLLFVVLANTKAQHCLIHPLIRLILCIPIWIFAG